MALHLNGENIVLAALLTGRFLSLHTGDPSAGANEVATGAYTRMAVTFAYSGGNPRLARNNADILFPVATVAWGTVTHWGLWDASTVGNILAYGALTASKAIDIDDVARFLTNAIVVSTD